MSSSPPSKPVPASPADEESPFSSFASTLSPINPVNGGGDVRNVISIPSPQPVFTSPHVRLPTKGPILRRFHKPESCSIEKFSFDYTSTMETTSKITGVSGPPLSMMDDHLVPRTHESNNDDLSCNPSCSSTSASVDEFLADPMEVSDGTNKNSLEVDEQNQSQLQTSSVSASQIVASTSNNERKFHVKEVSEAPPVFSSNDIVEMDITLNFREVINTETPLDLAVPHNIDGNLFKECQLGQEMPLHVLNACTSKVGNVSEGNTMDNQQLEPAVDYNVTDGFPDLSASSTCGSFHVTNDIEKHLGQKEEHQVSCFAYMTQEVHQSNVEMKDSVHLGVKPNISTEDNVFFNQEGGVLHPFEECEGLDFKGFDSSIINQGCNGSLKDSSTLYGAESPIKDIPIGDFTVDLVATSIIGHSNRCKLSLRRSTLCNKSNSNQINECSSEVAPRPSGIGLHLNSVGGLAPCNYDASGYHSENDLGVKKKSFSVNSKDALKNTCSEMENNTRLLENGLVEQSKTSTLYQQPLDVKHLKSSVHMTLVDRCLIPCDMKMPPSDVHLSKEIPKKIPNRKRKKAAENDGCKRCNCKRSKCLKLYCECFAAGAYCTDECFCHGCSNKAEYIDKVQETRGLIVSRNPLAFAPKVVLPISEAQEDAGVNNRLTPSSARHKRGCNCKKSHCLKKYCECFQEGVGCTLGCRCEGCNNTYGRKEGLYGISETEFGILLDGLDHKLLNDDGCRDNTSFGGKLEINEMNNIIKASDHCGLSPLTPNFQNLSEKDAPESQAPTSHHPSPDSGSSNVVPVTESLKPMMVSVGSDIIGKSKKKSSEIPQFNPGPDFDDSLFSRVNALSPGWDGFPDICCVSPLKSFSPMASGSVLSLSTKLCETPKANLFQGGGQVSVRRFRLRSSPVTPLPQVGNRKMVEPDSDSGLLNLEDDTPDMLKDDTGSPAQAVKTSSPNKKRILPPNKSLYEPGSSASPSLRSGRKYVLRSVPSFPPLTPYSNNNNNGNNNNKKISE